MKPDSQVFSEGKRAAEASYFDRIPGHLTKEQRRVWSHGWWAGAQTIATTDVGPSEGAAVPVETVAKIGRLQAVKALVTGRLLIGIHARPLVLGRVLDMSPVSAMARGIGPVALLRVWWGRMRFRRGEVSEPAAKGA